MLLGMNPSENYSQTKLGSRKDKIKKFPALHLQQGEGEQKSSQPFKKAVPGSIIAFSCTDGREGAVLLTINC